MSTLFNELVLGFPSSRKTLTLYDVCECVWGGMGLCVKEWAIDRGKKEKELSESGGGR